MILPVKSTRAYDNSRREAKAALTRETILDALCALLVEERPVTVSMNDVAERSGLSLRTVYHHFPNKEALFEALGAHIQQRIWGPDRPVRDTPMPASPRELIEAYQESIPRIIASLPLTRAALAAGIDNDDIARERRRQRLRHIDDVLTNTDTADAIPATERRKLVALIAMLCTNATVEHLTDVGDLDADETANALGWAMQVLIDAARKEGPAT